MPVIARDKWLHLLVGSASGLGFSVCYSIAVAYGLPWAIFAVGVIIGAVKEVIDRVLKSGTPDFKDFLFTAAGGGLAALVAKLALAG